MSDDKYSGADPHFKAFYEKMDKIDADLKEAKKKLAEKQIIQDKILDELGLELTFEDVMALLKDDKRLKTVVSKLKLKAFW